MKRSMMATGMQVEFEGMRVETRGTWRRGVIRSVPMDPGAKVTIMWFKHRFRRCDRNIRAVAPLALTTPDGVRVRYIPPPGHRNDKSTRSSCAFETENTITGLREHVKCQH